jgi:lysophospholipase L1-like esterase
MTQSRLLFLIPIVLGVLLAVWWFGGLAEDPGARGRRIRLVERSARLTKFAKESPPKDAVVFLGSSTIEFWPLATSFPDARTVNRGIGEEPVHELRERLSRTLPPEPSGAVLYVGSVDFNTLGRPVADVVRDVEALIVDLRRLLPDLPMAIIGVNAARDTPLERAAQLAVLNASLAATCADAEPPIAFVNTDRAPFRAPDGRLAPEISRDRWHLNADGYARLAEWLREAAPDLGL